MMTALTVFLYIGASYLIYLACERPNVGRLLVAGLVLGIAAITRPAILPLAGILPVALLLGEKRRGWGSLVKGTVVFMAGILAPIAPVTAINYFVGGEAVLISTQGGVNFYMGNGAIADGITAEALGQPRPATGKYQDVIHTSSIDEAEASLGRKLSQSEVSSYWYDRALDDIAADPVRAVRLFLKKSWLNFHGQELINFRSPNYAGTYSTYMALTLWRHGLNFPSGLLFPFAICGIVLGWRQKKELSVLIMYFAGLSTVMAAFFVCARFRQPLVPAAAILSVYLIFRLAHNWRNLSSRPRFGLGMIVILVVGLNLGDDVGSSTHRSQFHALMGSCHEKARDYSTAADQFERALEISAENVGVYASLGECYMWMRLPDKAKTAFLEGVRRYPEFYRAHFGLARIAHMQRDYEEAKRRYYLTLAYSPNFVPAFEHLGQIYEVQKQPDSALHYYRQFQQFYPSPKTARKIEKLARDNAAPPRQSP